VALLLRSAEIQPVFEDLSSNTIRYSPQSPCPEFATGRLFPLASVAQPAEWATIQPS